ncbi:heme o synthase [Lacipirellula limnantheis]|uniref:Protoheme IX farnesyltransferase n=1 Tax=Lacipirellula limnantheis TaxID=2528024 RepID=A0A517U317_9BACT|nr:heme o synthase [Lacipirellula limnantheis]QDT75018.1 Protoheme IX farnesyltransferase 1 [Lacipirellula limnantheis]
MNRPNPPHIVAEAASADPRSVGALGLLAAVASRFSDYLELTKPRIVVLELIVAGAAAALASPQGLNVPVVIQALAATALVAGSASIANQWLERRIDLRMRRTANRPLPAGRVSSAEAIVLCVATLAAGVAWLGLQVNWTTAILGVASWITYVVIYTPLKQISSANTAVGAVAGAIPILMGWTATGAPLDLTAWTLAGVLFLWQFPHFMAIAWLYRAEYARAGHQMLTVVDPTGARAGVQAITGALLLIPVSMIPAMLPTSGSPSLYSLWAIALGGVQLALAIRFAVIRDESSARLLLRATLIYLPAWMTLLLMVSV